MAPRTNDERTVTRTYRAAIRMGEDFITLEETVTLPIDASDEDVAQAIDLGLRVYQAQRAAVEAQIASVREAAGPPPPIVVRDPDAPASDKQRNFIGNLQDTLGWNSEQLASYANDQGVDLVTITKGQASTFIDGLKKLSEDRPGHTDGTRSRVDRAETNGSAAPANPANEKQLNALARLAKQHGTDLDAETQQRYGVAARALSYEQASTLLAELQRSPQNRRAVNEPAL